MYRHFWFAITAVVVSFLAHLIPWLVLIGLYNKTPDFQDQIAIRKEMRYILIIYFAFLVATEIAGTLVLTEPRRYAHTTAIVILIEIKLVSLSCVCIVMTYWVLRFLNDLNKKSESKREIFVFKLRQKLSVNIQNYKNKSKKDKKKKKKKNNNNNSHSNNNDNNNNIGNMESKMKAMDDRISVIDRARRMTLGATAIIDNGTEKEEDDDDHDNDEASKSTEFGSAHVFVFGEPTLGLSYADVWHNLEMKEMQSSASRSNATSINSNNNDDEEKKAQALAIKQVSSKIAKDRIGNEDAYNIIKNRMGHVISQRKNWVSGNAKIDKEDDTMENREFESFRAISQHKQGRSMLNLLTDIANDENENKSGKTDKTEKTRGLENKNKNKNKNKNNNQNKEKQNAIEKEKEKEQKVELPVQVRVTLQMIFTKMQFFTLFMNHLEQEFCAEVLLFIIEVIQAQILMLMFMHQNTVTCMFVILPRFFKTQFILAIKIFGFFC